MVRAFSRDLFPDNYHVQDLNDLVGKDTTLVLKQALHILRALDFESAEVLVNDFNQKTRLYFVLQVLIQPIIISLQNRHDGDQNFVVNLLQNLLLLRSKELPL